MEQTSGSSTRDDGGGGGEGVGSGSNKAGKKSDDDEDLARIVRKGSDDGDGNRDLLDSTLLRMRIARKLRSSRLRWGRGHLHRRRDATMEPEAHTQLEVSVDLDLKKLQRKLPALTPTSPSSTTTITSINTNSFESSDQIVFSSSPPPSPAESGPSFSTTITSTRSSEVVPVTTVTSSVSAPVVTVWNGTTIRKWCTSPC